VAAAEQEAAVGDTGPRAALRVLSTRDFGPYFVGNAASATGTWFQNLAAALFVYRATHSPFLLGVLNFSYFLPTLVLVPWTGRAADQLDRRRFLLAMQVVSTALGAALAALAWAGLASVAVVIGLSAALGVAAAFANTASSALLPQLVTRADLASAVGLNSVTYNLARAVGPALAAVSVRTLGIPASFAINAASYLLLAAGLLVVRPRASGRTEGRPRLRESLRLVVREPRLAGFLVIVAVVGFASDPINTLAPAYAHVFGHPDTFAGYLIGAFGIGAIAAAFLLAGRIAASGRRLTITLVVLGLAVAAFSLSPSLGLAFPALFLAGMGYLASNTGATSRLQLEIEESQRGRIMALWGVAFLGLRPFASLLDGAVAGAFGVRAAGVALAAPALVVAAVLAAGRRRLAR
jgi:MFS family permease